LKIAHSNRTAGKSCTPYSLIHIPYKTHTHPHITHMVKLKGYEAM